MNREDYRAIKGYSKEQMERFLWLEQNRIYNTVRKQYEEKYQAEINNSIQNFLYAIAYTLHFSDELNLQKDELKSFMDDLFMSVDMFRKGEWKPDDYDKALKEDGITFDTYDYDKLYRIERDKANLRTTSALDYIKDKEELTKEDINTLKEILGGV